MDVQELVKKFESLTPEELLSYLSGEKDVSEIDLQLIEELRSTGLNDRTINVLLHYVNLVTKGELPSDEVKKIAAHWKRKEISTVQEAMEFARTEHEKHQKWRKEKSGIKEESVIKENSVIKEVDIFDSIMAAIKAGLSDEQLGKYVKNLLDVSKDE